MNYKEYGELNNDVIVLLHGGGLSWWNYRKEAEMLQNDFHVIIPILDGHAESDRNFTTIEDNAKEIITFIDEKFDSSVLLIGGLSLGGQILLEILSQRADICEYAIIESALVLPSKLTYSMIKPVFVSCFGLIKQKWFSKLQFKSLKMNQEFFDDYYRDTCKITKQNMIAFLQENSIYTIKDSLGLNNTKVNIFVGEKENRAMKISAKKINEKIEGSSLRIIEKMYHGEFSINHADDYVKEIYAIAKKR
ncbi:alpha/beta fold hydrolase [Oscillospiraceae bacterium LCP25S3_F9]